MLLPQCVRHARGPMRRFPVGPISVGPISVGAKAYCRMNSPAVAQYQSALRMGTLPAQTGAP